MKTYYFFWFCMIASIIISIATIFINIDTINTVNHITGH